MSEVPSRDALDGTSFGVKQGGAEGSGRIMAGDERGDAIPPYITLT
jgi:hypothetical protein